MSITPTGKFTVIIIPLVVLAVTFFISWNVHRCHDVVAVRGTGAYCTEEVLSGDDYRGLLTRDTSSGKRMYRNDYFGIEFQFDDPTEELQIDHEHSNSTWFANQAWYSGSGPGEAQWLFITVFDPAVFNPAWQREYVTVEDFIRTHPSFIAKHTPVLETESLITTQGVPVARFDDFYLVKQPGAHHVYLVVQGSAPLTRQAVYSLIIK